MGFEAFTVLKSRSLRLEVEQDLDRCPCDFIFPFGPQLLQSCRCLACHFQFTVRAQDKLRVAPSSPGLASWPVQLGG